MSKTFSMPAHTRVRFSMRLWQLDLWPGYKIVIAVGTATSILAAEKNAWASCGMPMVNMW